MDGRSFSRAIHQVLVRRDRLFSSCYQTLPSNLGESQFDQLVVVAVPAYPCVRGFVAFGLM